MKKYLSHIDLYIRDMVSQMKAQQAV
jgi:hypothetical protein